MEVLITDSANPKAYPISGFVWMLIYENEKDPARGDAVARLAWWVDHDGQKYTTPLEYAALRERRSKKTEDLLKKITVDGKAILATN